ncbi:probable CTP1 - Mitochondrial citrate transporter - member of the mitochondrial carrier (MCF) family [Ustilago trichophora]|uniref:Probable CTP1 - Mitochondrial citrate transporter - member of the mitochondrial carrier (MCF) family n=1 Tax=Ustilago trichophora TaxID=86804 RepID=A0A5C3EFK6_9BASI|nr:probable CTP1 - Mitochondrial citrate transporter - member of the mitochondrial carrier (MCF) family [Ustilago trichophora]
MSATEKRASPSPMQSLLAGTIAGAVEGFLTYPTEFVKTQAQLASNAASSSNAAAATAAASAPKLKGTAGSARFISYGALPAHKLNITPTATASSVAVPRAGASAMQIVRDTWRIHGVRGFFQGAGAMVTGNSAKAGVRFLTYDTIQNLLRPKTTASNGAKEKLGMGRSILAGFLAGSAEAMLAVTPSEAVKTRMIQDSLQPAHLRKFKGPIDAVQKIVAAEGLAGLYRGLGATVLRQGANSSVRLTSYSVLKSIQTQAGYGKSTVATFASGAGAGLITVYLTMPFDVVKTRLQQSPSASSAASAKRPTILSCGVDIVKKEGVKSLWKGTTPRLTRLIFSGGIAFTTYETVIGWLNPPL